MKVSGKPFRTIWLDQTDGQTVSFIDQRQLPFVFHIEKTTSAHKLITAISDMQVRGAGLIGATAGFAMYLAALEAPDHTFAEYLHDFYQTLIRSRPTARNLIWSADRVMAAIHAENTIERKKAAARSEAQQIADEDAEYCRRIGEHGVELISRIYSRKKSPVNILTHCNAGWLAFVDFGSATAPIYAARNADIPVHVWVGETRPWNQGARLTAWELQHEQIPHTLITDNCGGHLMQHGMVDLVIVGSDRTTSTGDVANKIGTYLKALAAKDNNVPFFVALPSSTIDWNLDKSSEIPIEQRSEEEITTLTGIDEVGRLRSITITPPGTRAANYGFDVTPARLISGLITERGIVAPDRKALQQLFAKEV